MNLKKTKKMISLIILITCIVVLFSATLTFAKEIGGVNIDPSADDIDEVQDVGNQIMGIIRTVGIITSVVVLMILGIKYMVGSAEEKAEYKKTMIPFLVGAILLFAASTLASTIYNWASKLGGA